MNAKYVVAILLAVVGVILVSTSRTQVTVVGDSGDMEHIERSIYRMLVEDEQREDIEDMVSSHGYTCRWISDECSITIVIGDGEGEEMSSHESVEYILSRIFT